MSSSGIRVHASFKFGADKKEKLLEVMRPLIEATRKEEGCIMYELFEKVRESTNGIFCTFRVWGPSCWDRKKCLKPCEFGLDLELH